MKRLIQSRRSSALVIILAAIALLTGLVVALLITVRFERASSHLALDHAQSDLFADLAADTAIVNLRSAIDKARRGPNKTWSSEAGRIRIFNLASQVDTTTGQEDHDMFSAVPGADDPAYPDLNNVDLNRQYLQGTSGTPKYPIAPPNTQGGIASTMKVGWIPLPKDPSQAPSKTNPIIGRIAFWVDDESCKVNLNTADGSSKVNTFKTILSQTDKLKLKGNFSGNQMGDPYSGYFGFGTPSEISLAPLIDPQATAGSDQLQQTIAHAIAKQGWNVGFNSAAEVNQVPDQRNDFYDPDTGFYALNKFNITHTAKSPDINMFGEPKIYLFPAIQANGIGYTMLTGGYATAQGIGLNGGGQPGTGQGKPINFIYPTSTQLPVATNILAPPSPGVNVFPQYPEQMDMQYNGLRRGTDYTGTNNQSWNYRIVQRMANYLGFDLNSNNQRIVWPNFSNATVADFRAKYTGRQIDNITMQIVDMAAKAPMADQIRYVPPSIAKAGFVDTRHIACGVGRTPKLTEVLIALVQGQAPSNDPLSGTTTGTPPFAAGTYRLKIVTEFYFPKGYRGNPYHGPYAPIADGANTTSFQFGGIPGAALDNALHVQTTSLLGVAGQTAFSIPMPSFGAGSLQSLYPGGYRSQSNQPTNNFSSGASTTGNELAVGAINGGGGTPWSWKFFEFAPLDGLAARTPTTSNYTSFPISGVGIPVYEGKGITGGQAYIAKVEDPLVNKFPGDWYVDHQSPVTATMAANVDVMSAPTVSTLRVPGWASTANPQPAGSPSVINYFGRGTADTTQFSSLRDFNALSKGIGDDPNYLADGRGDPMSLWMPRTDDLTRSSPILTKMSRFPSVGALNYVRTGVMPDAASENNDPPTQQHGTPWRSICFDSSSGPGQRTSNGRYPDWVMLDLFTVPFVPQPPYVAASGVGPRLLTYGGATEGRLNINNPTIPYPFSRNDFKNANQNPPQRTAPLEALFYGIEQASDSTKGWSACYKTGTADGGVEPVFQIVDSKTLAKQVGDYVQAKGPFILPGQLADVPQIANFTYTHNRSSSQTDIARSRNDVMRDVVGAITTQSNTYSIWVVAQTITKNPNAKADAVDFAKGDRVTGETRRHYIVERYIDAGPDGIPGTSDDPRTITYPLPYQWKMVAVEDIK